MPAGRRPKPSARLCICSAMASLSAVRNLDRHLGEPFFKLVDIEFSHLGGLLKVLDALEPPRHGLTPEQLAKLQTTSVLEEIMRQYENSK